MRIFRTLCKIHCIIEISHLIIFNLSVKVLKCDLRNTDNVTIWYFPRTYIFRRLYSFHSIFEFCGIRRARGINARFWVQLHPRINRLRAAARCLPNYKSYYEFAGQFGGFENVPRVRDTLAAEYRNTGAYAAREREREWWLPSGNCEAGKNKTRV